MKNKLKINEMKENYNLKYHIICYTYFSLCLRTNFISILRLKFPNF